MKKGGLIFILLLFITLGQTAFAQVAEVSYGKKGLNTAFELEWLSDNYGTIQWQISSDNGASWTDIAGATSPSYIFRADADALYRVRVDGDPACDPFLLEREIKVVDFDVNLQYTYSTEAEFEVTNMDLRDADIIEYGYCYNYSAMGRSYLDMHRVKLGERPTIENNGFTFICEHLQPNTSYSIRLYLKTLDGSLIFGPGRVAKTTYGMAWTTEDWQITQEEVVAKFELPGYLSSLGNPNATFLFGENESSLQTISCTREGDSYNYTSERITGLKPNTEYMAVASANIDGERIEIKKTVKTLSDYSNLEVDETVTPVGHTIRWDATKTLHQVSPTGIQAEYPRMLRVSEDTILCAYHGGKGSDHWVDIYMQKSFDNGDSWTEPTTLFDRSSIFGGSYYRFANPELVKLQNGWILMPFIGNGNPEVNDNCHVMVSISKDNGNTWGDPIVVGRGRTWEPMILQLPNGELELYVASEAAWWGMSPRPDPLPQEILCSRSTDNGLTWTEFKRASYSPGRRDGMPVATLLQGNKGILFVIEIVNDAGFGSPTVVKRKLDEEWDDTEWNGANSDLRWRADINGHGGAPYMIQLPTGEIVISAHTGNQGVWQTGRPRIIVGDNTGHNFSTPVSPLAVSTTMPGDEGAYYNSLFLKDEETVWLVITHCKYNGNTRLMGEIKYLEGKIVEKQ